MSADDIYKNFHVHVKGTHALSQAQTTSYQLASSYQQQAVDTQRLIDDIQSGWTGDASEAASQGLAPMATNLLETGDALNTHQQLIDQQVGAFHTTASKVHKVPPKPSMWDVIGTAAAGIATDGVAAIPGGISMYDQVTAHDAVSNANVDAYNQYVKTSRDNAGSLPDLSGTLPDKITAPVSVMPPAPVGTAQGAPVSGGPTAPRSSGRTPQPVASGPAPAGQGPTGVWTPPSTPTQPTPPVTQVPPQSTTTQGVNPVSTSQLPVSTPTTVPPSGSGPVGGTTGWLFSGGTGSGGNISSRLGSGSSGSGAGGLDEFGGTGSRSGAPNAGAEANEGSARSGSVAAEEEALARGTTGAPGTPGAPMGGRGGRREQDAEHQRRYTYDEDPDVFDGDLPKTPPPVIGA
jgi:hypothetical protein